MRTENYTHRGYEIQITHNPPIWQAAIYASKPNMLRWLRPAVSAARAVFLGAMPFARGLIVCFLARLCAKVEDSQPPAKWGAINWCHFSGEAYRAG
jgi:hypothetical protein